MLNLLLPLHRANKTIARLVMAVLLSLRAKLVYQLMSIPYDTTDKSLQVEMSRLTKEINLINSKLNKL